MSPPGDARVGAGGEPSGALICNANGSSPRERGKRDGPCCGAVQPQRVIPTPPARLPAGTVDMLHTLRVGCQPETLKHSPLSPRCGEGEGWKKW